jgi:hypothetical protein
MSVLFNKRFTDRTVEISGKIMTDQPTNSFTNHGGIIDFKGKSYLFYHTGLLPGAGSYGRSTSIEEFKYNQMAAFRKLQ